MRCYARAHATVIDVHHPAASGPVAMLAAWLSCPAQLRRPARSQAGWQAGSLIRAGGADHVGLHGSRRLVLECRGQDFCVDGDVVHWRQESAAVAGQVAPRRLATQPVRCSACTPVLCLRSALLMPPR